MACRSWGMPLAGVYLVNPSARALTAASLICCGVSKSGSPAPKPTTSCPSAFICLALESMARVRDGLREAARWEILYFIILRDNYAREQGSASGIWPGDVNHGWTRIKEGRIRPRLPRQSHSGARPSDGREGEQF